MMVRQIASSSRRLRNALALICSLGIVLVACAAPVPTARPSLPLGEVERVREAFAALDDLASYRWGLTATPSVVLGDVMGTVVNGDPFRMRYDITVGGATVGSAIFIGDQTWQSVQGSEFRIDPDLIVGPDDPMPFEPPFLDSLVDAIGVEIFTGETIVSRPATRLRLIIEPQAQDFQGILNFWVDDERAVLLRAEAAGTTRPASAPRRASPVPLGATVLIGGFDDPGNAVTPPL